MLWAMCDVFSWARPLTTVILQKIIYHPDDWNYQVHVENLITDLPW